MSSPPLWPPRRLAITGELSVRAFGLHVRPSAETLPLAGKMVRVHEWVDGRVELRCEGRLLPYSIFDRNPIVTQGAIVENKRLGAVLAAIQADQTLRDQARLASRKLSLREKDRLRAARARAGPPTAEARPTKANRTSLLGRKADISTWV